MFGFVVQVCYIFRFGGGVPNPRKNALERPSAYSSSNNTSTTSSSQQPYSSRYRSSTLDRSSNLAAERQQQQSATATTAPYGSATVGRKTSFTSSGLHQPFGATANASSVTATSPATVPGLRRCLLYITLQNFAHVSLLTVFLFFATVAWNKVASIFQGFSHLLPSFRTHH